MYFLLKINIELKTYREFLLIKHHVYRKKNQFN